MILMIMHFKEKSRGYTEDEYGLEDKEDFIKIKFASSGLWGAKPDIIFQSKSLNKKRDHN